MRLRRSSERRPPPWYVASSIFAIVGAHSFVGHFHPGAGAGGLTWLLRATAPSHSGCCRASCLDAVIYLYAFAGVEGVESGVPVLSLLPWTCSSFTYRLSYIRTYLHAINLCCPISVAKVCVVSHD